MYQPHLNAIAPSHCQQISLPYDRSSNTLAFQRQRTHLQPSSPTQPISQRRRDNGGTVHASAVTGPAPACRVPKVWAAWRG